MQLTKRTEPLIVDSFAGLGGASFGISLALGREPDIAINHDREAIALHQRNHPRTRHFCESVWSVDPLSVTGGRPVGLLWASPDCKHFSKAKGGKPVENRVRGLAWVVVRWAKSVRPAVIILENVEEFADWGPLNDDGLPDPKRRGHSFRRWLGHLKKNGYAVEHRELRACDYGAPTSRKRLFVIARSDGRPIAWPEPTHGDPGAQRDLFSRQRRPWRTALECIDWSLACPSIFDRDRPLADATDDRIASGLKRFILSSGTTVPTASARRAASDVRLETGLAAFLERHALEATASVAEHRGPARAFLVKFYGNERDGQRVDVPLGTVTTKDRFGLVVVSGEGRSVSDIGLRMLTPRELARAQGFPDSFSLDVDVDGAPLSKTAQTRMVGNSVCPPIAAALVRANVPLSTRAPLAA